MFCVTMTYMITSATAFGLLGLELLHVLEYAKTADGWLIIPCIGYIIP